MGLTLTGPSTAGLARQRTNPNAWQHPRHAFPLFADRGRASPSMVDIVAGTEQMGWQAACIPRLRTRNKVRRFVLLAARFAFDVLAAHGSKTGLQPERIPRLRNAEQTPSVSDDLTFDYWLPDQGSNLGPAD